MKTYATKLTGRVVLALLVSTSPLFGADTEQTQEANKQQTEQKQEAQQAGWSTRKKIGVGATVALGLGGSAYATYRFNPELIKTVANSMRTTGKLVGDKAVIFKNYVTDKTRSLLGYDPKPRNMMDYANVYRMQALCALGFISPRKTLKQKAMCTVAKAYAKALPMVSMVKEVSLSTAQNHPWVIVGSMALPTSGFAGRGVYVHYKSSEQEVSDVVGNEDKEIVQDQEVIDSVQVVEGDQQKTHDASACLMCGNGLVSGFCSNGRCGMRRSGKKAVEKSIPVKKAVKKSASAKKSASKPKPKRRRVNKSSHNWIKYSRRRFSNKGFKPKPKSTHSTKFRNITGGRRRRRR